MRLTNKPLREVKDCKRNGYVKMKTIREKEFPVCMRHAECEYKGPLVETKEGANRICVSPLVEGVMGLKK